MADEQKAKPRLEIAHVLFMDMVDYSKLLTDEQSEALQELNQIVRNTEAARQAEAAGQLTILPTGDGMALVFTGSVEEPVECALEISHALRAQPSLPVRMGIHSGPVHHVKDANERENIAGVGINIAQRVMDCGDAGHILVSKRVADDLAQQRRWQPYLHELGDVEVKHGVVISLVNFYAETIGNPAPPTRIGKVRGSTRTFSKGTRKALSPVARAIFIIAGLLIALIFVLAILSVIFAPAIMRTLDKRGLTRLPQPSATASPSLADTIKSEVAKKITDELKDELSDKRNAAVEPSPTGSAIPGKSIAVLPFENLSSEKENAYFAEGIQDEILTRLSKIAGLKVISRTSTQRFKSVPSDLREIAKQLGVMHIVEGSVQKANDQVRVNVQLINAMSDAHLWADTYDRKLTDLFAVESEIAKTIADTLQAKLTGSEKVLLAKTPTANPEAYQLYLKGRFFWNKRTAGDLRKSIDYFNEAIAKDPGYALAYAGAAQAWLLLPGYSGGTPRECFPHAETAARKALSLDESSTDAHAALGMINQLFYFDSPGAIAEFQRAIELDSNNAIAHHWFAFSLSATGQIEREMTEMRRALELDPLSLIINTDVGQAYIYAHRFDDAITQLRRTLEMDNSFYFAHYILGQALELKGRLPEAMAEFRRMIELNDAPFPKALLGHIAGKMGRKDEAREILQQLRQVREQRYFEAYGLALLYLGLDDREEALRWLEQSYQDRDGFNIGPIRVDPFLDSLHGDPRFEALAEKIMPARDFARPLSAAK